MTRSRGTACLLVASLGCVSGVTAAPASLRFDVRLLASARTEPVDGRLIVVVSKKLEGEPRFQVVPPDTKYVRRISVESALLSRFWGRPVVLRAVVLVPEGF